MVTWENKNLPRPTGGAKVSTVKGRFEVVCGHTRIIRRGAEEMSRQIWSRNPVRRTPRAVEIPGETGHETEMLKTGGNGGSLLVRPNIPLRRRAW